MGTSERTANAIDEILALLRSVPNIEVFDSLVEEEEHRKIHQGNAFTPYVVVTFSGTSKVPTRYRSMTGVRDTGENMSIVVRVVAHSTNVGRDVRKHVHSLLLGYTPEGCGEIAPALYFSTGMSSTQGSPVRYSEIQSYELMVS